MRISYLYTSSLCYKVRRKIILLEILLGSGKEGCNLICPLLKKDLRCRECSMKSCIPFAWRDTFLILTAASSGHPFVLN